MVAGVIDNITIEAEQRSGAWTVRSTAVSEAGVDLSDIVRVLGGRLGFSVPELPKALISSASVEHRPGQETTITARLPLPPDLVIDLSALPLVGESGGHIALEEVAIGVGYRGGGPWRVHVGGKLSVAGDEHRLAVPIAPEDAPPDQPQLLRDRHRIGPLTIDSLMADVHGGALWIRVNGRLGLAGVAVDVIGLHACVPLDDPRHPRFGVDGLAITYHVPPVLISGGLVVVEQDGRRRFDGALAVRAGDYGLSALGSYAGSHPPSLFAFLQVLVPIGGPPAFYVKGLAGGFGVNRELRLPPVEGLSAFPLIQGSGAPEPFHDAPTVDDAIRHIEPFMGPLDGRNWLAAGVAVGSFGVLDTQALLTLSVGGRVEIGLLGLTTLEFPPAVPEKVVRARMALRTVISPAVGELSVLAQLTPDSYLLAPGCRLTGGFALGFWFKPSSHAGDFVVSLGGYHPRFKAPSHYPAVPRLGLSWAPEGVPLKLKGSQYFALTPGLVMCGGLLDANWDEGPIRARFRIQTDFVAGWAPFHYELKSGVSFAVDARLGHLTAHHVSIHVGAELHLWGPAFGGRAHVDLGVMGLTIAFGDEYRGAPDPLDWAAFRQRFLEPREHALTVQVRDGLLAEAGTMQVVDPETFELATETAMPAKEVTLNGLATSIEPQREFGIAPMRVPPGELGSVHAICVERRADDGSWAPYDGLAPAPVTGCAPKALWLPQPDLDQALDGEGLIDGMLTGVRLRPKDEPSGGESLTVDLEALGVRDEDGRAWSWGSAGATSVVRARDDDAAWATLTGTIGRPEVAARRAQVMADVLGDDARVDVAALTHRDRLRLRAVPALVSVAEA